MRWISGLRSTRWAIPAVALAAGLAIGQAVDLSSVALARPAGAMTPLQRLLIQDDIRQRIVLYGLYADGSGPGGQPRDLRKLAYTLMTPDVVSEIHLPGGGEPLLFTGRELVAKTPPEVDPELAAKIGGRHYLVNTVFDEVSPTRARTRTTAVYFDATKNPYGSRCKTIAPDACAQKPVKTVMWIYDMIWLNTPDGWQISRNILRDDN